MKLFRRRSLEFGTLEVYMRDLITPSNDENKEYAK